MANPKLFISKKALKRNLDLLIRVSGGKKAFPVLKANSYGVGLKEVASFFEKTFSEEKVPFFCVARVYEAALLRSYGVKRPVLVLSEAPEKKSKLKNISHMLVSLDEIKKAIASRASFHLKLNSGMNRLGISIRDLKENPQSQKEFLKILSQCKKNKINIEGVSSHLACGEEMPTVFSNQQLKDFSWALDLIESVMGKLPTWVHLANSPGILQKIGDSDTRINAFRPGVHLWGVKDFALSSRGHEITRVLTLKAPIRQLYWIEKGESVGYGRTFVASKKTRVGILNMGYADGLRRSSSQAGLEFSYQDLLFPFLGNISMDLCAIDLSAAPAHFKVGTEVEWLGENLSLETIATAWNTIPYEVLTSFSSRVERVLL
jgi:alanine racemase